MNAFPMVAMAANALLRYFSCWRRVKIILVLAVILLALTNLIATLLDVSRRPVDSGSRMTNALRSNGSTDGWPRDGVATKYISIEVLSSKDHVKVSVDDATVIDDSGSSNNRGLHVVVLNQHTGMVMAQRVFDTYMDDEPLIGFLQSVSTGRIMIFAIKDEASFHLTNKGRRAMQMHIGSRVGSSSNGGSTPGGSLWLSDIGWRDMWAMVAKHYNYDQEAEKPVSVGGHVYGEGYSRNPGIVMQYNSRSTSTSSLWGADVMLRVQVPLDINHGQNNQNDEWCESWRLTAADFEDTHDSDKNLRDIIDEDIVVESQLSRRQRFCNRIEGYGDVCSCTHPAPLDFHPLPLPDSNIDRVPVIIIAGNRADYLYRTLKSVLNARGVQRHMITVHVDGYYDEPVEVARLLGVRAVQHMPAVGESISGGGGEGVGQASSGSSSTSRRRRVTQHYKSALTNTFGSLFPQAEYAIVLEDDLDVSVDFFSFFSQTLPLLAAVDDSVDVGGSSGLLYCISAWNDQGYVHTASRPDVLYRVDWMPGLGWMLKRSLYKDQLESEWPTVEKPWDWDMWMRTSRVQRGRQCIVPEVSRTYHFGSSRAINVNPYFQRTYFSHHAFYNYNNAVTNGVGIGSSGGNGGEYDEGGGLIHFKNLEKMTRVAYLEWMEHKIVTESHLLDHTKWPCRKKQWNAGDAKYAGSRNNDNSWSRYNGNRDYRQSDEEFFAINDMIKNDERISSKKLFLLYIKMDDPNGINKDAASIAWTPLAKCLGIWDLDIRGHYKGMWRLYLNNDNEDTGINVDEEGIPAHSKSGTELFIIGCPFSYFCKFKPTNVTAIWYDINSDIEDDDEEGDDIQE